MGLAIAYFATVATSSIEKANFVNEKIAAQRIFYTWMGVADNFQALINISIVKNETQVEFNDSLPATEDKIKNMLDRYQKFIDQYIEDPTIAIRCEDANGNEVNLNQTQSKIVIKPMNINYSWPNYGKNKLFIEIEPVNFSYVSNISIYVKLKNVDFNCKPPIPGASQDCEKWNPDNSVDDCTGIEYCLYLNLTFEDQAGRVFTFSEGKFNVDNSPSKKSVDNLNVINITSPYAIDIEVGPLPTVINIDLHNTLVDTSTKLNLTTSEFYMDIAARLNVTSVFGKKVDWL